MTRDDIIRMAKEADALFYGLGPKGSAISNLETLERFAAIMFEKGQNAEAEMVASIIQAQDIDPSFKHRIADAIRARGEGK